MEKIQEHYLEDKYRLKDGLIVEVKKYQSERFIGSNRWKDLKKKKEKGVPKTYVLKESFHEQYGEKEMIIPNGGIVKDDFYVIPTEDVKLFKVEVKSSGGSIYGSMDELNDITEKLKKILKSYE